MLSDATKFGAAVKVDMPGSITLDPLLGRMQTLVPSAGGFTAHLPSLSAFGSKFSAGGLPVLYLVNPTSHSVGLDQPDSAITGTLAAGHAVSVVVVPDIEEGLFTGPAHYRFISYVIGTPSSSPNTATPGDCTTYRQARTPTNDKPGSLVNVWIPTSSIPDTGGVDWNFLNFDDNQCYYIHFGDPESNVHGHVPIGYAEIAVTNSNVDCCSDNRSTPECLALPNVDGHPGSYATGPWSGGSDGVGDPACCFASSVVIKALITITRTAPDMSGCEYDPVLGTHLVTLAMDFTFGGLNPVWSVILATGFKFFIQKNRSDGTIQWGCNNPSSGCGIGDGGYSSDCCVFNISSPVQGCCFNSNPGSGIQVDAAGVFV